jgi:hypothetical protein
MVRLSRSRPSLSVPKRNTVPGAAVPKRCRSDLMKPNNWYSHERTKKEIG